MRNARIYCVCYGRKEVVSIHYFCGMNALNLWRLCSPDFLEYQTMAEPYQPFLRLQNQFLTLTSTDEQLIKQLFEPYQCPKATPLVESGKVASYMYFINTGFIRGYHYEDGNEITNHLGGPNSFITAYLSFSTKNPSDEVFETLTPSQLLRITKDNLDQLYRQSHNMALFGLFMADQYLVFNNQRSRDLITLSAEQRYLKLMQQTPTLLQHVPLQYIASYIGVKPESLSRIRRKMTTTA